MKYVSVSAAPVKGDLVCAQERGNWVTFFGVVEHATSGKLSGLVDRTETLLLVRLTAPRHMRGVVELWGVHDGQA